MSVCVCARIYMCVRMCMCQGVGVMCLKYSSRFIFLFEVVCVHFVDLVSTICSPLSARYIYIPC